MIQPDHQFSTGKSSKGESIYLTNVLQNPPSSSLRRDEQSNLQVPGTVMEIYKTDVKHKHVNF